MATLHNLRSLKRFITGHDADGKAIFLKELDNNLPLKDLDQLPLEGSPVPAKVALAYATNEFPVKLHDAQDLRTYEQYLKSPPGISIKNGTVLRVLDFPPGSRSPMHATQSLDYGICLEGSVKAGLDSGEFQILEPGDIVVQRATNHDWSNASQTEWARMLFVLCDAQGSKEDTKLQST